MRRRVVGRRLQAHPGHAFAEAEPERQRVIETPLRRLLQPRHVVTALVLVPLVAPAQSVWYEKATERDLTGDGRPETLLLRALGSAPDSLIIRFTIEGTGGTLYRAQWLSSWYFFYYPEPLDSIPRETVERTVRRHLEEFLSPDKFRRVRDEPGLTPEERELGDAYALDYYAGRARADSILQEMLDRNVPTFTYFSGYELIRTIAWSPSKGRFYVILECC